jgi:gas vesicle protein
MNMKKLIKLFMISLAFSVTTTVAVADTASDKTAADVQEKSSQINDTVQKGAEATKSGTYSTGNATKKGTNAAKDSATKSVNNAINSF